MFVLHRVCAYVCAFVCHACPSVFACSPEQGNAGSTEQECDDFRDQPQSQCAG